MKVVSVSRKKLRCHEGMYAINSKQLTPTTIPLIEIADGYGHPRLLD